MNDESSIGGKPCGIEAYAHRHAEVLKYGVGIEDFRDIATRKLRALSGKYLGEGGHTRTLRSY
jgi:hypothetical protein